MSGARAGEWNETLSAPAEIESCYSSSLEASGTGLNGSWSAGPSCWYGPPSPPPPPPPPGDDDNNCGGSCSPIIIDIVGDGVDLNDSAHGVAFDIDGDGSADRISWTRADSDDAFLWLDGNGNGTVDSGMELFGDAVYDNGFDKLKTFDDNGDGIVDAHDAIWPSLRLWLDANHNGISDASEISTVASSRFTGIAVTFKIVGKRDKYGNRYRYKGRIYTGDHANGGEHVYDIILMRSQDHAMSSAK
jgi:hypothetical protein